jgi:hypothetical protein
MPVTAEVNFSDLLQRPKDTLANLRSGSRRIRLRRRDDEDLMLTTASRDAQEREVVRAATRVFQYLCTTDLDAAADLIVHVFPWLRFLPGPAIDDFLHQFLEVLESTADLDTFAPVWQLIMEWKHTAEVHADPDLLTRLRQDGADHGPVPAP